MEFKNRHWMRMLGTIAMFAQLFVIGFHITNDHSAAAKVIDIAADGFMLIIFFSFTLDWFRYKLRITEDGIDIRPQLLFPLNPSKHFSWESIYSISARPKRKNGSLFLIQIFCFSKFSPSTIVLNKQEATVVLKELAKHISPGKWKPKGLEILESL